ncbi:hypothetical protein OS122_11760 [Mycolicibacterium mucogenicum]|uniref:hypothetical protein n=1 Tax=Mycolicibacterium mucogenicum TaxID=56689 RepID=UPI00226A879B|nr:hypothetical protein [Mycolicibacterium mucogenicum]MCX8561560.1 hypothetical protein [Mycolicibacterium mucogenicum]
MTNEPERPASDRPTRSGLSTQWAWFGAIVGALGVLGFGLSFVLMLPLAMATDSCHDGSTDWVCKLSARGQYFLIAIPWICLIGGVVAAVVTAALAARRRWTPLVGIPAGIAVACALIPIGKAIALHV